MNVHVHTCVLLLTIVDLHMLMTYVFVLTVYIQVWNLMSYIVNDNIFLMHKLCIFHMN